MSFVALHLYSGYSFLKSGLTIPRIIKCLKNNNFSSCAITDYHSLVGIAPFYNALKKYKFNPIIGLDIFYNDMLLTFIVKNETGYRNLIRINLETSKKTLNDEFIKDHKEGLIVILSSKEANLINKINDEKFIRYLAKFSSLFETFYIGLESYSFLDREEANLIREFANKYTYNLVAFPFIKCMKKEDSIVLKIVDAISRGTTLTEKTYDSPYYFRSLDELKTTYLEEEISETNNIAKMVDFSLNVKRGDIYKLHDLETSKNILKEESINGLKKKIGEISPIYMKRLNYELDVINKMGYQDYFLIVQDYCSFAKESGILVGPGRGSAGGSLVAYALDIVEVDPIKYNLLFERFLNIERQSMPDIDLDFEDTRRNEVYEYIKNKYGNEYISNIVTTQNIGAKQALQDIGRIYEYENRIIKEISKTINDDSLTFSENYRKNQTFRKLIDSDKYFLEIIRLASKIEGLPRQRGQHPAGVIINKDEIKSCLPLTIDSSGNYVSEISKDYLEDQGFYKMDILNIKTLTVIKNCLNRIKENGKVAPRFSLIPHDDINAIKMIRDNNTMGLYQLESPGMKKAIETIKIENFEDVVALLALFRPGPMENIPLYAARKNKKLKINYLLPELEKILAPTYGIIVYQEQIMQVVQVVAGFSFAQADNFRRAISKKDMSKMESLKKDFINGAIKNNISEKDAVKVFNLIEKFANYGFNRCHSLQYAVFATRMAYLKYHYPLEFYASILDNVLDADSKDSIKINGIIKEIKSININVKGPDINKSTNNFIYDNSSLIFPLHTIKGITSAITNEIIKERDANGKYLDLFDFIVRLKNKKLSEETILKLINAGAFDSLHSSRQTLRESVRQGLNYAKLLFNENDELLFDTSFIPKPKYHVAIDDLFTNLNLEFESLGLMISASPLPLYKETINKHNCVDIINVTQNKIITTINIAGVISGVKKIKTKKGTAMAFIEIYDDTRDLRLTIFPDTYQNSYRLLEKGNILIFNGKFDHTRGEFIVNSMIPLEVKNG